MRFSRMLLRFRLFLSLTYESLQDPKLAYFFTILFILQMSCYYIGEGVAPDIYDSEIVPAEECPRAPGAGTAFGTEHCVVNEETYYFRMPYDASSGGFSRWQRPVRAIFQLTEPKLDEDEEPTDWFNTTLNIQLSHSERGHRKWSADSGDMSFHEVQCKKSAEGLACSVIPIMMLENTKYPYYMMSIQLLNVTRNLKELGVTGATLNVVSQNAKFCVFWIFVKIILSCCSSFMLYMFVDRMRAAQRPATFFEKILRVLLCTLFVKHLPLEQVITILGLPFGTTLSVFTSGVFFSSLFAMWLVYACECLPPTVVNTFTPLQRTRNALYYVLGCSLLLIYYMYETAMRSFNPYYNTRNLQLDVITLINTIGCTVAIIYFIYVHISAWRAGRVQRTVQNMPPARVRRMPVMLLIGLLCGFHGAGSFILSKITNTQYSLASWKWLDLSAVMQGKTYYYVFAYFTWMIYVHILTMMFLPERAKPPPLEWDEARLIALRKQKIN